MAPSVDKLELWVQLDVRKIWNFLPDDVKKNHPECTPDPEPYIPELKRRRTDWGYISDATYKATPKPKTEPLVEMEQKPPIDEDLDLLTIDHDELELDETAAGVEVAPRERRLSSSSSTSYSSNSSYSSSSSTPSSYSSSSSTPSSYSSSSSTSSSSSSSPTAVAPKPRPPDANRLPSPVDSKNDRVTQYVPVAPPPAPTRPRLSPDAKRLPPTVDSKTDRATVVPPPPYVPPPPDAERLPPPVDSKNERATKLPNALVPPPRPRLSPNDNAKRPSPPVDSKDDGASPPQPLPRPRLTPNDNAKRPPPRVDSKNDRATTLPLESPNAVVSPPQPLPRLTDRARALGQRGPRTRKPRLPPPRRRRSPPRTLKTTSAREILERSFNTTTSYTRPFEVTERRHEHRPRPTTGDKIEPPWQKRSRPEVQREELTATTTSTTSGRVVVKYYHQADRSYNTMCGRVMSVLANPLSNGLLFIHNLVEDDICFGFAAATANTICEGFGVPYNFKTNRSMDDTSRRFSPTVEKVFHRRTSVRSFVNLKDVVRFTMYNNYTERGRPPIVVGCDLKTSLLDACCCTEPEAPTTRDHRHFCYYCLNNLKLKTLGVYVSRTTRLLLCGQHAKLRRQDDLRLYLPVLVSISVDEEDDRRILFCKSNRPHLVDERASPDYGRLYRPPAGRNPNGWSPLVVLRLRGDGSQTTKSTTTTNTTADLLSRFIDCGDDESPVTDPIRVVKLMREVCGMLN